jgi:hypothetical protein
MTRSLFEDKKMVLILDLLSVILLLPACARASCYWRQDKDLPEVGNIIAEAKDLQRCQQRLK